MQRENEAQENGLYPQTCSLFASNQTKESGVYDPMQILPASDFYPPLPKSFL